MVPGTTFFYVATLKLVIIHYEVGQQSALTPKTQISKLRASTYELTEYFLNRRSQVRILPGVVEFTNQSFPLLRNKNNHGEVYEKLNRRYRRSFILPALNDRIHWGTSHSA